MFIGHYAPAFALKGEDDQIPLWQMFVAVQFIDYLWAVFGLMGIEHFEVVPGITAANPLDLIYYPYSHSLMATIGWGVLCAIWMMRVHKASMKAGVLIGLAVLSHWFTDLLVHTPDLPLYGDQYKVGFGLWNMPMVSMSLEIGLVIAGIMWWKHRTRAQSYQGMVIMACVLGVMHLVALFGTEPPSKTMVSVLSLVLFTVFAFLAYWLVDRPAKKRAMAKA